MPKSKLMLTLVATSLAGCGDSDGPSAPLQMTGDPTACVLSETDEGWTFTGLGVGSKPTFTLGGNGAVHAAFMQEATPGWVRYARLDQGQTVPSVTETVATGYFYGPIDIQMSPDGTPAILYHDHDREGQVLARVPGSWDLNHMVNTGHDGWYNAGVFDEDGILHTATYDPGAFGGRGVIYGSWDGSTWDIEVAAPGSFDYAGGMAIAHDADGRLHITFFDDGAREAKTTTRDLDGSWMVQTLEERGANLEMGRFPDLVLDPDGTTLHAVYLTRSSTRGGSVRYAVGRPGNWTPRHVIDVDDFDIGFTGARDLATLTLDAQARAVVAAQTRNRLRIVRVDGEAVEDLGDFSAPAGVTFGQQTEIAVDADGRIHVVWWQTGGQPGTVCHAVTR